MILLKPSRRTITKTKSSIIINLWGGDATFLTENSEIIKKEVSKWGFGWSLTEAVNVLKDNKDVLAKENGQFTGKKANSDGSKHLFKIEAAQSW